MTDGALLLLAGKLLAVSAAPLAIALALCGLALATLGRRPRLARWGIGLAIALLWAAATPIVANALTWSLERRHPSVPVALSPLADAAILLGGSVRKGRHVEDGAALAASSTRVLHAARLLKWGRVQRIVIVGGNLPWLDGGMPEADLIRLLLVEWGVPAAAILSGGTSRNTYENAQEAKPLLTAHNIRRSLLVTSAAHMPRALAVFRRAGIEVIPSPTDFRSSGALVVTWLDLLPSAGALAQSSEALKEWLGYAAYRLRGWL